MKKILSMGLISLFTLVLSTGCNSMSGDPEIPDNALEIHTHGNEKALHAIEKAGAMNGWTITEFKINEVIAEKTNNGDTISSSIKVYDNYIIFENPIAASALSDDIEDELNKDSSSH